MRPDGYLNASPRTEGHRTHPNMSARATSTTTYSRRTAPSCAHTAMPLGAHGACYDSYSGLPMQMITPTGQCMYRGAADTPYYHHAMRAHGGGAYGGPTRSGLGNVMMMVPAANLNYNHNYNSYGGATADGLYDLLPYWPNTVSEAVYNAGYASVGAATLSAAVVAGRRLMPS